MSSALPTLHDGTIYHPLRILLYALVRIRKVRRDRSAMGRYWDFSRYRVERTVILVTDIIYRRWARC